MKNIRILIADDHSLIRLGLSALLGSQKNITIVGEAQNGREACALAGETQPDIVVMDLLMPEMDGVEATRFLHANFPQIRVLILTSYGTSSDLSRAIAAGAAGAIAKDAPNDELIAAIFTVADGGSAFSEDIARYTEEEPNPPELSQRQSEILHSITRGLTNRDIAIQLGVSADCIKQHLNAIFHKLGAATRSEAVAIALRKQLIKS